MKVLAKKKFRPGKDWVWYAPHTADTYGEKEIQAVVASLRKGWLTLGTISHEFENRIAALFGKKYGLFVNSGSSANLLSLEGYKFPKGSEVITPACNFNTTVSPIIQTGLVPVFIDVGLDTYTINVALLEKAVSKKTVAVMAPHLIGNFVDLPKIKTFCKEHNLIFIEDSCDTIGGTFRGKPSGSWSDITTTSFYASHIITTGGAGGMVMTNNNILRERLRVLRDWGRGIQAHDEAIRSRLAAYTINSKPYDSAFVFAERGYNFRPTEMQAAFGLAHLNHLQDFISIRRGNYERLRQFFGRYEEYFILPREMPNTVTNWLAFPLTIKRSALFTRNDLVCYLEDNKIQTRPLFSGNILQHPGYADIQYRKIGNLQNSQQVLEQSFLIGLHHGLVPEMLNYMESVFVRYFEQVLK